MKYLEIQWMPFGADDQRWWVFENNLEEGKKFGSDSPTGRIVGQFPSAQAALDAFPAAKLSDDAKRRLAEEG